MKLLSTSFCKTLICTTLFASQLAYGDQCGVQIDVDISINNNRHLFSVGNVSPAGWSIESMTLDLSPSFNGLALDMQKERSFEIVDVSNSDEPTVRLKQIAVPPDNLQQVQLTFAPFSANSHFNFAMDVIDPSNLIEDEQVQPDELQGTNVYFHVSHPDRQPEFLTAVFDIEGRASLQTAVCDNTLTQ